jgi:hypothetical protein
VYLLSLLDRYWPRAMKMKMSVKSLNLQICTSLTTFQLTVKNGATTLSIMTLCRVTISIMTLSTTKPSIMKLGVHPECLYLGGAIYEMRHLRDLTFVRPKSPCFKSSQMTCAIFQLEIDKVIYKNAPHKGVWGQVYRAVSGYNPPKGGQGKGVGMPAPIDQTAGSLLRTPCIRKDLFPE